MSLVAYGSSEDENTTSDEEQDQEKSPINNKSFDFETKLVQPTAEENIEKSNKQLPEEEKVVAQETFKEKEEFIQFISLKSKSSLKLPREVNQIKNKRNEVISFDNLPAPKNSTTLEILEEDDEFIKKKPIVQIILPSLNSFKDVEKKPSILKTKNTKSCSLLSLLPKPKQDMVSIETCKIDHIKSNKSLVPDSLRNKTKTPPEKHFKTKTKNKVSDSDNSGDECDFFSLKTDEILPVVSASEVNEMVAKRVAHMAEVSTKIEKYVSPHPSVTQVEEEELQSEHNENQIKDKAIKILVGSRAKRKREEINIVDLSSADVLPNKEEWLRNALASTTSYQMKGVLTDEESVPGTRKKHQITYLAHQAKANEQELQAMWAANKHTRRQTQSKYGF